MKKLDKEIDQFEMKLNSLPQELFCPIYNKLLIVSLRNLESKNKRALLLHVPDCEHKFCKLVASFFKGIIDDEVFVDMVNSNISKDEERSTRKWK
ncbi:MAG: hypothetical protein GTO02_22380 [Candidatus Dadabacteria bacterium]|nr:hypothetical protein [Candidatus Dadabacteria bacterium]